MPYLPIRLALVAALSLSAAPGTHAAGAQEWGQVGAAPRRETVRTDTFFVPDPGLREKIPLVFSSRADSLAWEEARRTADRSSGFRLIVSLQDRQLWVVSDADTLLSAPVGVASGTTLEYQGRMWRFHTPRGVRTVRAKEDDPIWTPPEWHYAEAAVEHGLKLGRMRAGQHPLPDGRALTVRDSLVGVIDADSVFLPLRIDEHIVFGDTLYVPPVGTRNRQIKGQLGRYRLDLGEGYLLHGTPDQSSVGRATTHGCLRLRDADIEWLFEFVPVGTRVFIY